jgi:hypothetical protein
MRGVTALKTIKMEKNYIRGITTLKTAKRIGIRIRGKTTQINQRTKTNKMYTCKHM